MEKVTGIAYWANVQKPNIRFDPKWQVDLEVDKKTQKTLKDMGIKLLEKPDGRVIFRPKRAVKDVYGNPNEKPVVYDKFGNEVDLEIGNGSEVEVVFSTFPYKKIAGIGADLVAVKINKLVPYSRDPKDVLDFEKDEGAEEENPFD